MGDEYTKSTTKARAIMFQEKDETFTEIMKAGKELAYRHDLRIGIIEG